MVNDFVYDIETFPNVFTLTVEHVNAPLTRYFEISPYRNDGKKIMEFLMWLKKRNGRMIGFNNIGFDYPVLHVLIQTNGFVTANTLYNKAMAIINSQNYDGNEKWQHQVYAKDRFIDQIDVFKIHHFDNKARATGLKILEFNMRSESIEDLPFPVGSHLTQAQIPLLKSYNIHDVRQTKKFANDDKTKKMIAFREELTHKYNRDFMNHNDTKIGKDYFIMKLEEAQVPCYEFGSDGRKPRQTRRPVIHLSDAILPTIIFESSEFNRVLIWLKSQSITETKGVFKDLEVIVNGFPFVFGTGGIHGSVESKIIQNDDDYRIIDIDVKSYYPSLSIANRFYPEHLGETFCDIYKYLFEERKKYPKFSAINEMLKLALNGVYGDSNSPFSVFYDPLFTMKITLNGQLLLCMLAEQVMKLGELIQINTDGLTVKIRKEMVEDLKYVQECWEKFTGLQLEEVMYEKMFIRDVNNYIAVSEKGCKRKGDYEYDREWHQNHSALVVPKVVELVLLQNASIRETVTNWPDVMDFMLRTKVPRSSRLVMERDGGEQQVQNTTRYYVAKGGGNLVKIMPPLKGKTSERRFNVESGWGTNVCNKMSEFVGDIDYDYYIQEVEKLCLVLS